MRYFVVFLLGILTGAISWGITPLISDKFEPFDSDIGFLSGQIIMGVFTAYLGYKFTYKYVLIAVLGLYIGLNSIANIFGDSAWWQLGLITISILCIIPLITGLLAIPLKHIRSKKS